MPAHRRPPGTGGRPRTTALEVACVAVVLLAVALLLLWVVTNWSTGRTNVLG